MTGSPPPHPDAVPLAALIGTWSGTGHGEYPTIAPFDYVETVVFAHVGKPFLSYQQRTADAVTGLPLHAESGYLRTVGGDRLELVVAQPTGIVELHEGRWSAEPTGALTIELATSAVSLTATAVRVDAVRRSLRVEGDLLAYELDMAAVGLPMTHHLSAELRRTAG